MCTHCKVGINGRIASVPEPLVETTLGEKKSMQSDAGAKQESHPPPPFDDTAAKRDRHTAARMHCVSEQLLAADAYAAPASQTLLYSSTGPTPRSLVPCVSPCVDSERRVAACVDQLLGAAELPANPFPALAKLLRRQELEVALGDTPALEATADKPSADGARSSSKARTAVFWRDGYESSSADAQLALLPGFGAAWKGLAGMLDGPAIRALAASLESTQLLASAARAINTAQGTFTIKSCCALTGAHVFAGRVLSHARTIEIHEHVQVRGPGSHLDAAIAAFAEHICASALSLHATREHFVQELEIFTGDGDAFDEVATADIGDGRATSNARGTPDKFGLVELHARTPAMARALQAAAMAQLPVYLHLLVCVPLPQGTAAGLVNPHEPPRWEFAAVQKRICFHYEPTLPGSRTAAGSRGSPAAPQAGAAPAEPAARFQPLQLQSLFQAVWVKDADAAWYSGLRANRVEIAAGNSSFGDARNAFMAFVRAQACRFLMRRDYLNLLETLLLLLPESPRSEREPMLSEIHACCTSHAAEFAELAHQSQVVQRALMVADDRTTPEAKRAFAHSIADCQCHEMRERLQRLCSRAKWADVEPVKAHLLDLAAAMHDAQGRLQVTPEARRNLRRLRRACQAVHQTLLDTLISVQGNISSAVSRIWEQNAGVEVPVSLQAPSIRVKVVNVDSEREQQRKTKTYPASQAREAVLMQYVVDTQLERALAMAMEDVYTARVVKGNPMHAIVLRVKAASQYFELWREPDDEVQSNLLQVSTLTIHDLRRNIYAKRTSKSEAARRYITSSVRWGDVSGAAGGREAAHGGAPPPNANNAGPVSTGGKLVETEGARGSGLAIYGVRPSLLLADHVQLHDLRGQLAELMPMRTATVAQRYECAVNTAFTHEMLWQGSFADVRSVHVVELREDHFIRGSAQDEVLSIHCQHVVQSFLRVHYKTRHLATVLMLGDARWPLAQVVADEQGARVQAAAALKRGLVLQMQAFALVRGEGGEARYISVSKVHHLCHMPLPTAEGKAAAPQSWPARTTQLFDSVFLSPAHVQLCLEAESTTLGDPLQSWRAKKWASTLAERAHVASRAGDVIPACAAVLQRDLLHYVDSEHQARVVPTATRLLSSSAARLRTLSHMNRVIQGVLDCARVEENRVKLDNRALVRMFHAYRTPVLEFLSTDACCTFEAMRVTIQEAVYGVLTDLRMQGVLGSDAQTVLEAIEDYMRLVEISVGSQVVSNDLMLSRTLAEAASARAIPALMAT